MNEKIPETLILIQGEPEYKLIDACGDCSFWYSPAAKKKYALLSHDDHGLPYSLSRNGNYVGTYGNQINELLTPDIPLDRQEVLRKLGQRYPEAEQQYKKFRHWHRGKKQPESQRLQHTSKE